MILVVSMFLIRLGPLAAEWEFDRELNRWYE